MKCLTSSVFPIRGGALMMQRFSLLRFRRIWATSL